MLSNAYARFAAVFAVAGTITLTTAHAAGEHVAPAMEFAKANISQWAANSHLIKAIQAQNVRHSVLTQSQIENLDRQWRAEVGADHRPLIEEILGRPVSIFLASIKKQHHGTVMEVFVMDNRGLNVAQSDVTSDYWQGDEAKFKKTYPRRPGCGVHRRGRNGRVDTDFPVPGQHVHQGSRDQRRDRRDHRGPERRRPLDPDIACVGQAQ